MLSKDMQEYHLPSNVTLRELGVSLWPNDAYKSSLRIGWQYTIYFVPGYHSRVEIIDETNGKAASQNLVIN
jgi:hypothetical protein